MSMVNRAIGVAIALIIVATLLPTALFSISMADTSGWNSVVATVFTVLLPLLAVLGVVYLFLSGPKRGSMMASRVIQIAVVLIIVASILPLAISQISSMPTATTVTSGTATNTYTLAPAVVTLTKTLLPIIAVIGITLGFFIMYGRRR